MTFTREQIIEMSVCGYNQRAWGGGNVTAGMEPADDWHEEAALPYLREALERAFQAAGMEPFKPCCRVGTVAVMRMLGAAMPEPPRVALTEEQRGWLRSKNLNVDTRLSARLKEPGNFESLRASET